MTRTAALRLLCWSLDQHGPFRMQPRDDGGGGDGDGDEYNGDESGAGAGRLQALYPLLADGHGYRHVRCGGGGFGRPVSLDAHRLGRLSYLLTLIFDTCTAST